MVQKYRKEKKKRKSDSVSVTQFASSYEKSGRGPQLGPFERPGMQCAESEGSCYCGAKLGPQPSTLKMSAASASEACVHPHKYTLSVPSRPECGRCPLFNVGVHNVPSVGLVFVLR